MEQKETVLSEITAIFRKELNEPALVLDYASSAQVIDKWDSINNLVLLSAIEERFQVSFDIDFILQAENVGDLCDFVVKHSTVI